ncbi:uncharacterized protein ARMOST_16779 [Armillaria ostoyae]|uniref:Uncharacterized protein n=1 Tax=Armillaria ostoyae TaxID=47428 RepID=A0A284RX58_ARMOS|nr:uncharacterized protein ARMOST_16779 [Armillaria ostoyae]
MYFAPTTQDKIVIRGLSCGGSDSSKITGSFGYAPITTTYPASVYWGIDESITHGTSTAIFRILREFNVGSTLVYNASNAFTKYMSATGETLTGLLRITQPSTPSFPISPSRTARFDSERFEAVQGPRQIAVPLESPRPKNLRARHTMGTLSSATLDIAAGRPMLY